MRRRRRRRRGEGGGGARGGGVEGGGEEEEEGKKRSSYKTLANVRGLGLFERETTTPLCVSGGVTSRPAFFRQRTWSSSPRRSVVTRSQRCHSEPRYGGARHWLTPQ